MGFEKLKARWADEREAARERAARVRSRLVELGAPVFARYEVRRVVLFGSVLEGRSTEQSDVDILVSPLAAEDYWNFRHELEEALGTPVDVYTEDDDQAFVRKIAERGETVYAVQR